MLEFDDKIAVLLRKIDEIEPLANELEKLLHQPSMHARTGQVG
jgi:hypothetical protein